ncbi:MAG: hypothetical protein IPN95_31690 [Bacteroidetes bacterium]|nr:hypothetical protein [Bacteroidota bacterium]
MLQKSTVVVTIAPMVQILQISKSAKDHADALLVEMNNKLATANEAVKVKVAQEKAAKGRAAKQPKKENRRRSPPRCDAKPAKRPMPKQRPIRRARDQVLMRGRTATISKPTSAPASPVCRRDQVAFQSLKAKFCLLMISRRR